MQPTPRTFEGYLPPPDPVAWEKKYGVRPYMLTDVPGKYFAHAAAVVFHEERTLDVDAAIRAKVQLDGIYFRVHADMGLDEDTLVCYRAADRTFWAYPMS
jgi:hypothetical protein